MQAIIDFCKRLFGIDSGPTPMSSLLNVQTQGDLGPLGQFVLALVCNEEARIAWLTNRAQAIANSSLSSNDKSLLTAGVTGPIADQIVAESGGTGSRIWICVWIK